ncbi:MAG: hypothetical protein Q7K28_01080, partial [Candidatus Wildermuthbacteria bacterium]|nr:hypothetical protein [Candidatus Wildermuthbacteria bacterium]
MLDTIRVSDISTAVRIISAIDAGEFLSRLVQFDTSIKGPTEGADTSEISRFLLRYITGFGISAEIVGPSPKKANVVWRVPA